MYIFDPKPGAKYRHDYERIAYDLNAAVESKRTDEALKIYRAFCRSDIFFLIYFVLNIVDINHPWLVDRCAEVQDNRTRTLDLWARYHYKSTMITCAAIIQDILINREIRVGIFSHTRDIAKAFLRRIKVIFESNEILKIAFGENILYDKPKTQAAKWSEDDGLIVKRSGSYGESTVEAWGLVDSMPVSKHYDIINYDDIVVGLGVATESQRRKVDTAFKSSFGLLDPTGTVRATGTRWHHGDQYSKMIKSGEWNVREYPATLGGEFPAKPEGARDHFVALGSDEPVMLTPKQIWQNYKDMGRSVFACQMLLKPEKADTKGFALDWFRYYRKKTFTRNYIFVDPANSKKESADFTVMWVVGIDVRGYYFVCDGVRDRLNPKERVSKLFSLVERWKPLRVYYETYGMQSDIDYIEEKMRDEGINFRIKPTGGKMAKPDRIQMLQAPFMEGKILFPEVMSYRALNKKMYNLTETFIDEEFVDYPACEHKDMLDCLARIKDPKVRMAKPMFKEPEIETKRDWIFETKETVDWMSI